MVRPAFCSSCCSDESSQKPPLRNRPWFHTGNPKSLRLMAPGSGGGLRPNKGEVSSGLWLVRETKVARDLVSVIRLSLSAGYPPHGEYDPNSTEEIVLYD